MAGQTAEQIRQEITVKMITSMEAGTMPWRKPWVAGANSGLPWNFQSKRRYTGINTLILFLQSLISGYASKNWGTAKSWLKNAGLHVKRGEKSTYVTFYSKFDRKDAQGRLVLNGKGEVQKIFMMKTYSVFNAEQLMAPTVETLLGVPKPKSILASLLGESRRAGNITEEELLKIAKRYLPKADRPSDNMTVEAIAQAIHDGLDNVHQGYLVSEVKINSDPDFAPAEALIDATGADIRYVKGSTKAAYNLDKDYIVMPTKASFNTITDYYQTCLHELGHWAERSDRVGTKENEGPRNYAWCELVAEMSACFTLMEIGVPMAETMLPKSEAYLKHWLEEMGKNTKYLFEAATWASKVTDYLLGFVGKANPSYESEEEVEETDEVAMREAA